MTRGRLRTGRFLYELLQLVPVSVAAVSLATLPVACGSYGSTGLSEGGSSSASSSTASSGGTTATPGGGTTATPSGGATVTPGGGTTATPSGGATATPSGGATVTPSGGATVTPSGGATVKPSGGTTVTSGGGATGAGGGPGGGATGAGGRSGSGGATGAGGASAGAGGGSTGTGGSAVVGALPCDILNSAGQKCVAAHSTVRVILSSYTGPLYEVCKGTANPGQSSCKGTKQDIGSKNGYADAATQDAFCTSGCTITKIYDQSGQKYDLEPAARGSAKNSPDNPADAKALPVTINGHSAYGILIKAGIGYRTGCKDCNIKTTNGMATGDQPQTMYWITSQKDQGSGQDGCCFDYGNAETSSNDDGNGTMETLYFGAGVVWGTGSGGKPGPWLELDLENGLYAGWENGQDKNISTNKPLKFDFVTGVGLGDTKDPNGGKGRFALYGGDATSGTLQTMYDGIRPAKPGYVPMQKQGSLILGTGGDNSNGAGGRFYEGACATGPVATKETVDALQAAIVAAKYGK